MKRSHIYILNIYIYVPGSRFATTPPSPRMHSGTKTLSGSFSKVNAPKRWETWREYDWIRIGFLGQITQRVFSSKVGGLGPHFSPVVFSVLEELALNNTSPFSVAMQLEEMALLCLDTSFQPSFSSVRIFSLYLLSEVLAGKFCSGSTCPRFPLQCTVCFEK